MRAALGFIVGLLLFVITVWCCEFGFSRIDPPPPGLDPRDPMMLQLLSPLALWLVLLGWAIASVVGGFVGTAISRRRVVAIVIGIFATSVGVTNNLEFPPPAWFWVMTVFAFVPFAYLGARLAKARQPG